MDLLPAIDYDFEHKITVSPPAASDWMAAHAEYHLPNSGPTAPLMATQVAMDRRRAALDARTNHEKTSVAVKGEVTIWAAEFPRDDPTSLVIGEILTEKRAQLAAATATYEDLLAKRNACCGSCCGGGCGPLEAREYLIVHGMWHLFAASAGWQLAAL